MLGQRLRHFYAICAGQPAPSAVANTSNLYSYQGYYNLAPTKGWISVTSPKHLDKGV